MTETAFDRANRLADEATARQLDACDGWWMDAAFWDEIGPIDSIVEAEAMENILNACPNRRARLLAKTGMAVLRELWQEVTREPSRNGDKPLAKVLERQRLTLIWISTGKGKTESIRVRLKSP